MAPLARRPIYRRRIKQAMNLTEAMRLHQLDLHVGNRGEKTIGFYRLVLTYFLDYLAEHEVKPTLDALNLEHARGFLMWIREQPTTNVLTHTVKLRSAKTIKEYARSLKSFAHFCYLEGLVSEEALRNLRIPKAPLPEIASLTPSQLQILFRAVEERPLSDRNRAIMYFLLATGVRASELCKVEITDNDLREGRTTVWGKGSKQRYVYFDKETAKQVARYLAARPRSVHTATFLTYNGRLLNRDTLRQMIERLGQSCGIDQEIRCTPHTFRHTFAVTFLELHPGALFHLQELLGHTDLTMVRRYARIARGKENLAGPTVVEQLGLTRQKRR